MTSCCHVCHKCGQKKEGQEVKKKTKKKTESKHDVIAASHKQFKGHWLSAVLHSFPIDVCVMAIRTQRIRTFIFLSTSLMRNLSRVCTYIPGLPVYLFFAWY